MAIGGLVNDFISLCYLSTAYNAIQRLAHLEIERDTPPADVVSKGEEDIYVVRGIDGHHWFLCGDVRRLALNPNWSG